MFYKTKQLTHEVYRDGLFVIPDVVPKVIVEDIKKEMEKALEEKGDSEYKFGKAINMGPPSGITGPRTVAFFDNTILHNIAKQYGKFSQKSGGEAMPKFSELRTIMGTHDYRNDLGTERNGFLHFDRTHTFKFFLYLTDVTEKDGAFRYVPGSREQGQMLRELSTMEQGGDYKNIENRLEIDYADLNYSVNDTIPLEGPAGTIFVFDTDTFHMGGLIENGHERLVIRSHYV